MAIMKVAVLDFDLCFIQLVVATLSADGCISLLGDFVHDIPLTKSWTPGRPFDRSELEQTIAGLKSLHHILQQRIGKEHLHEDKPVESRNPTNEATVGAELHPESHGRVSSTDLHGQARPLRLCGSPLLKEAKNVAELRSKTEMIFRSPLEILSNGDHAAYGFLGSHDTRLLAPGHLVATVHVGTHCTEICLGEGPRILDALVLDIGTDPLTKRFVSEPIPTPKQCLALSEYLNDSIDLGSLKTMASGRPITLVASGRMVTSLSAMAAGHAYYDRAVLHGTTLSMESIYDWFNLLAKTPVSQRIEFPGLPPSLSHSILAGAGILLFVLDKLELSEVTVSGGGLRTGVLRDTLGMDRLFQ